MYFEPEDFEQEKLFAIEENRRRPKLMAKNIIHLCNGLERDLLFSSFPENLVVPLDLFSRKIEIRGKTKLFSKESVVECFIL